jgi:GTP-binding protein YchF
MGFKCGLIGLPNVGKSTIFNAMTNLGVEASAYPFCTIDPHFGIVPLEDERLDNVHRLIGSAKKTPTVLEFVDIAGLVQGASKGEGLGNQFLSHIGRVDAVAHIVRCFEDPNVSHPYETFDPVRDAQIVTTELILKDLEIVEKRLSKSRTAAKSGEQKFKKEAEALEPMREHLTSDHEIRTMGLDDTQNQLQREMNLLTAKPVIYIANVDEKHLRKSPLVKALSDYAASFKSPCIPFCGKIQAEIAELDQKDQLEFLQAMGLDETGLQKLVKAGYEVLDLITFFTANENEAHAWTVPRGTLVHKAAGRVHTDFETGFVKAEVIKTDDLIEHGSTKALHDMGLVAIHGKDYTVEDGDLIFFRVKK